MILSSDDDRSKRNYITSSLFAIFIIWIVKSFWPDVIPIGTWDLWHGKGDVAEWLMVGLPLFVWGVVLQGFSEFRKAATEPFERLVKSAIGKAFGVFDPSPAKYFLTGLVTSVWAGFAEEVAFRWLLFLSAIVGVKITNFLFLGFAGLNIVAWFHNNIFGWLADKVTFGFLHDLLYHPYGWAVGAALLSSNAFFRDGHKYQGILGVLNSWFAGMFFFWIAFHYGLWAAIVVHTTYDIVVVLVATIGFAVRK